MIETHIDTIERCVNKGTKKCFLVGPPDCDLDKRAVS